jgi:hypothetical protein
MQDEETPGDLGSFSFGEEKLQRVVGQPAAA